MNKQNQSSVQLNSHSQGLQHPASSQQPINENPLIGLQTSVNPNLVSLANNSMSSASSSQNMLQQILMMQKVNNGGGSNSLNMPGGLGQSSGLNFQPGMIFNKDLLAHQEAAAASAFLNSNGPSLGSNGGISQHSLLMEEALKNHLIRMDEAQIRANYESQMGGRLGLENSLAEASDAGLRGVLGQGPSSQGMSQQEYERRMMESLIKREELDKLAELELRKAMIEQEYQYQMQQQYMHNMGGMMLGKPYGSSLSQNYPPQVIGNPYLQQAISQQKHHHHHHQQQQQMLLGMGNPSNQMNLMMYGNYPYENGPTMVVPSPMNIYPPQNFGGYPQKSDPSNFYF